MTEKSTDSAGIEQFLGAPGAQDDDSEDMEDLREAFDDELADVEELEGYSRQCPACDLRGIPMADFRDNFLECPTKDCGVHIFRMDRGDR